MKALLIQHKDAGDGATSRKALTAVLKEAGWKVTWLPRKNADRRAIGDADADLIVVAGGDGTVAAVIKAMPDRSVPLAIIPTGTANDIARSLGIDGAPEEIIAGWDLNRRQRLDVGDAHCPWGCTRFAEAVGFGAFADSLRLAPDLDGEAKLEAGRNALRTAIENAAPLPLEVSMDGALIPDALLVECMIVPLTGPRLRLAPGAEPGDGKLHLAWLTEDGREAMLDWLADGARGEAPVNRSSGHEILVRGGGTMMRIDDESCWLEPESDVTIRLEGEPIQVLAPAHAPALAG